MCSPMNRYDSWSNWNVSHLRGFIDHKHWVTSIVTACEEFAIMVRETQDKIHVSGVQLSDVREVVAKRISFAFP